MEDTTAPKIFDGLTAWFSATVGDEYKAMWATGDGVESDLQGAMFVFSQDAQAPDTACIFSSGSYLTEHLAVFHPEFIVDCVREGHPRHVAIGKYFLPPHHLHLDIKSDVKFGWENLISHVNPGTNTQSESVLEDRIEKSPPEKEHSDAPKKLTDTPEELKGVLHIDELPRVSARISEFIIGEQGCQVFRCVKY